MPERKIHFGLSQFHDEHIKLNKMKIPVQTEAMIIADKALEKQLDTIVRGVTKCWEPKL